MPQLCFDYFQKLHSNTASKLPLCRTHKIPCEIFDDFLQTPRYGMCTWPPGELRIVN